MRTVLVHGAWQGAWAWDLVRREWPTAAPAPLALDLPSVSGHGDLTEDAAALTTFANDVGEDVILVAHSYGGAVATEAASTIPRLRGVIYLAALRPTIGQSATDLARTSPRRSRLDDAIQRDGQQLTLRSDDLAAALFGTTAPATVSWAVSRLHPQPLATFRQPLSRDVPANVVTHYVICERDEAVTPELQRSLATLCSATSILDSSHCPHLEYPSPTATLLSSLQRDWASVPN